MIGSRRVLSSSKHPLRQPCSMGQIAPTSPAAKMRVSTSRKLPNCSRDWIRTGRMLTPRVFDEAAASWNMTSAPGLDV